MKYLFAILIILILAALGLLYSKKIMSIFSNSASEYFGNTSVAELAKAAADGDEARVSLLASSGANPNTIGKSGVTPLLYVMSEGGNYDGLRALLKAGSNPNYMSPDGYGPMLLAAKGNDPHLLQIMLDGSGDPNLTNPDGEPVALLAILQHRWENLKILLDRGADINGRDKSGYTLLMNLGVLGYFDQAATLIDRGADINAIAKDGGDFKRIAIESSRGLSEEQREWHRRVLQMLAKRDNGI